MDRMDRSLDDITSDRQRNGGPRGGRYGRRNNTRNDFPRDGVRKPTRDDSRNIDSEWVHDKFNDRNDRASSRYDDRRDFYERPSDLHSAKVVVGNIHYDLTEQDLEELFGKIGRVASLKLTYDRAGRSTGTAFVTYESARDAQEAIKEFDGANAYGQQISLKSVSEGPTRRGRGGGGGGSRFESSNAGRSLSERMTRPRSRSPSPIRHSDVSKPPPDNVDRYVPGDRSRRTRSPLRRRGAEGRRPGARRERGDRPAAGGRGEKTARDGRPKKTQEELDAEMEDYFGNGTTTQNGNASANDVEAQAAPAQVEGDVEMVE